MTARTWQEYCQKLKAELGADSPWYLLIEAAPDMLKALRTAERLLLDSVGREKVRAAIAKAEGKS